MDEQEIAHLHATLTEEAELTTQFSLDQDEQESLDDFLRAHNKDCKYYDDGTKAVPPAGAIGGRLTYCFTPTTIGMIIKIKCACGAEKDVTDYDKW